MLKELTLTLPYPNLCSVNGMYKRKGKKVFLTEEAKAFKDEVYYLLFRRQGFGKSKISIEIIIYPPDNRIRDIDNILKITFDSMQYAGMYNNDSQIKQLYLEMMPYCTHYKVGQLQVKIREI